MPSGAPMRDLREQQQRGQTSVPQPAMPRLTTQHLIKHR